MTQNFATFPSELIVRVAEFIHPSAHLDFALSCRLFSECSRDILQHHQRCHEQHSVKCDILPETLPNLLRLVLIDPVAAWHVRRLEIWCARLKWRHWQTLDIAEDQWQWPIVEFDETSAGSRQEFFSHQEIEQLRDFMVTKLYFDESTADQWQERLETGDDGALKGILMAICPNLQNVNFLRYSRHLEHATGDNLDDRCLEFLCTAIKETCKVQDRPWAAGFASVQDLAVGTKDTNDRIGIHVRNPPRLILPLFRLPRLNKLYVFGLRQEIREVEEQDEISQGNRFERDEWGNYTYEDRLPADKSWIQKLILDEPRIEWNLTKTMMNGASALNSLVIRASDISDPSAVVELAPKTLQQLLFYDDGPATSDHCFLYDTTDLSRFQDLRQVTIDVDDLKLYLDRQERTHDQAQLDKEELLIQHFFKDLPKSLEAIIFRSEGYCAEPMMHILDKAVAVLIKSSKMTNLQAVYFEDLERISWRREQNGFRSPYEARFGARTTLWFQETIAVGASHDVDIHTFTNPNQYRHQIDFPIVPGRNELVTDPRHDLEISNGKVFDPAKGEYRDKGCGKCGACEWCHGLYPKSCWDARHTTAAK